MLEFNLRIGEMPYAPDLIVLMTECVPQSPGAFAANSIAIESAGAKYACRPPSAIGQKRPMTNSDALPVLLHCLINGMQIVRIICVRSSLHKAPNAPAGSQACP